MANLVLVHLEMVFCWCEIGERFALNVPKAQKLFWTHLMEPLGDWVMSNLVLVYLEMVLVAVKDRCTVGTKCTIGSVISLDAPDGTPR
jgi:hypothetical protein